jgi:hypothetical protein
VPPHEQPAVGTEKAEVLRQLAGITRNPLLKKIEETLQLAGHT